MHKIGILSDTHGLLRQEVIDSIRDCDVILHGGDINRQKILDELIEIAPVHVVRGNNDKEWAEYIPETVSLELYGLKIFMVHNKKFIPKDLKDVNMIIYGHSHKYEEKHLDGVCYLNPGSCGPRRFHQEITFAILQIEEDGSYTIEKNVIPHVVKKETPESGDDKVPADLAVKIPDMMKDIDAGKTVKQIAKKYKIPEELSEQINRMYLTHPGVDVDGILRRLGL